MRSYIIATFRDLPIRQKLLVISVLSTAAALLLTGIAIFVSDSLLFHKYLNRDLTALAQITADDSTAALAFNDPQSEGETLAALKARPHIVSACVYRVDGSVLARYLRADSALECPPPDIPKQSPTIGGDLIVSRPVLLHGRNIGTLVMLYDRGEIYARMRIYGFIIVAVLIASSFMSFLLSSQLRGLIATPILKLANTASLVSATRDYSIRAQRLSGDELGTLVDGFNEMLAGIQSRDQELRETLLELQRSNENLARSNKDLERFAFVASHDLQEPLRMITAYSQLLAKKCASKLNAEALGYMDHIIGGAKRMRELLADLLEFTHLGSSVDDPVEYVDLNLVLEKVLQNLKVSIDTSNAVISVDPLPTVCAREAHLIPLFQNLVGNAIKYRSEAAPRIRISSAELDGFEKLEVADNGIGIAPEYHEKIFIAFKRLHGKEIPGTGIGLAICQRVVERYGGRIWVESDAGNGSKFIFTLPKTMDQTGGESNDGSI